MMVKTIVKCENSTISIVRCLLKNLRDYHGNLLLVHGIKIPSYRRPYLKFNDSNDRGSQSRFGDAGVHSFQEGYP